jgi:hypothetical protein
MKTGKVISIHDAKIKTVAPDPALKKDGADKRQLNAA